MTVSGVFRKFVLILFLVCLTLNFSIVCFADSPPSVVSSMEQPVASMTVENGIVHLVFHAIYYSLNYPSIYTGNNYLISYDCYYPETNNVMLFFRGPNYQGLCSSANNCTVSTYVYDIATGSVITHFDNISPFGPLNNLGSAYSYAYTGLGHYTPNANSVPYFYIVPSGITVLDNADKADSWVTWATAPILQTYVHSVLPRPEADEYNRFVVLTSPSESHLLWLNYHFEFLYGVTTGAQQTVEYNIRQSDYYAPTLRFSDDGFSFRIQMDPILYLYLQNLNFSGTIACNFTLSDYNLITGEFVSMTSGNIEDLQPDIYYNMFNSYIEFDASGIDLYGLNYEDFSTVDHLHRAAVIYSTDPDFERWKISVLTWLENIYNVISATEAADDVTIEQDTAAASELHQVIDNLQPTDEHGSKVNTADVVSERFSDAQQYVSDLSVGAGEFNTVVDDFLFSNPFFYVPLIVALAAGLLITILGKNKSND